MKKYWIRSLKRLPAAILGTIGIGYLITLFISMYYGNFMTASPWLVDKVGSLKAAEMLAFYTGLMGASFTITQPIWEVESWSLFKSTVLYFGINLLTMLLVGWKMMWFTLNLEGVLFFVGMYVIIFAIIWVIVYFRTRKEAMELNRKIKKIS